MLRSDEANCFAKIVEQRYIHCHVTKNSLRSSYAYKSTKYDQLSRYPVHTEKLTYLLERPLSSIFNSTDI